jgi:hypothetical protein
MMTDGHLNKCKDCTKADVTRHRAENLDYIRKYEQSRAMLPHRVAARAEYAKTEAGKQSRIKSSKKYLVESREKRLETTRNYYKRNSAVCIARTKKYAQENIEITRARKAAAQNVRRAAKILRTPKWLTRKDFEAMRTRHKEARWMTIRNGIKHHVDHIVPLRGETVSGLHVPWNLRVIPARENSKKKNKF